jgi:hypothetical protein
LPRDHFFGTTKIHTILGLQEGIEGEEHVAAILMEAKYSSETHVPNYQNKHHVMIKKKVNINLTLICLNIEKAFF